MFTTLILLVTITLLMMTQTMKTTNENETVSTEKENVSTSSNNTKNDNTIIVDNLNTSQKITNNLATEKPLLIEIPHILSDPEKELLDYFTSIGMNAVLKQKDDSVQRGNEKGLSLVFDLGNETSFYATIFRLNKEPNSQWEMLDYSFLNPKGELLASLIEQKLDAILTMQKSNKSEQNKNAFKANSIDEISKYGEAAYKYMIGQFAKGNGKGERGDLMAAACIDILGPRNNVPKDYQSGEEWYAKSMPLNIIDLPQVNLPKGNTLLELTTSAALTHYQPNNERGVVFTAPHVFDHFEKNGVLTIWATVYYHEYLLYEKKLVESSAGVVPAAIKFKKQEDGSYKLTEYIEAKDGSEFIPSIKKFCELKKGVADKMINQYSNYNELSIIILNNLISYLKENHLIHIYLEDRDGEQIPLT